MEWIEALAKSANRRSSPRLLRQPGGFEGLQQQSGGHMNNGKEKESGGSPSRGAPTDITL